MGDKEEKKGFRWRWQVPTVEGNGSVGGEGGPQGTDPSLQPAPNGNQSQGGAPNQSEARQAFMAKVLSTVLCQLAFAFLCTIIFHYVEALKVCSREWPCVPDRVFAYHVAGPVCSYPGELAWEAGVTPPRKKEGSGHGK